MKAIEEWACRNFRLAEVDSVSRNYSGNGPPSWQKPRHEIEGELSFSEPEDWWHLVNLMELRRITSPDSSVLDIGCGPGWPSLALAPYVGRVVAVDASELAMSLISRNMAQRHVVNVHLELADATNLPFEDCTFDAVIASEIMDCVREPEDVAREMLRVLKPGGRFVSWVQNYRYILGGRETLRRSLERAGERLWYRCLHGSLNPPQTAILRFELDPSSPALERLSPASDEEEIAEDACVAELAEIRPAIRGDVELYRVPAFVFETAAAPFACAGFADAEVYPLNGNVIGSFARELAAADTLPKSEAEFCAVANALLAVMPETDAEKSWQLSVGGRRPIDCDGGSKQVGE